MTDSEIKTMADSFVADLATLRSYAARAIGQKTPLTQSEEADKSNVMARFWGRGLSLSLTHKDLVRLLFQGMFRHATRCGCMTCRARLQS